MQTIGRLLAALACIGLLALPVRNAFGHSVAQVQTTKFFAPETVQMLTDRATAGHPGFLVGDIVSYIIQFTPVENANGSGTGQSNVGTNGYITDYIPPGTEVVGAWIVTKSGSDYTQIPPSLPGGIDDGWGTMITTGGIDGVQQTYAAPFDVNTYDPTGMCAAYGPLTATFTANGNWTVPAGVTSVQVEAWGGGGAGGAATGNPAKGGGGGGGQYAIRTTIPVTPGNSYAVTVGLGGTGGGGAGGAGNSSSFTGDSAVSVVASGGAGGALCGTNNCTAAGGAGGTGGTGDLIYNGGAGSLGSGATGVGGSGGGGAGSTGTGGDANGNTGGTGTPNGGGNGRNGRTTAGAGQAGFVYGGAGSGGYATAAANRNGGNGAAGQVVITYIGPLYSNNCNERLTQHVADTGIFYSTDPRTAQYPPLPTRIAQSTNGYNINPTGAGQLNPIIGQTQATTHNLWDADQTNAFGTATLPGGTRSSQPILLTNTGGWGIGYGSPPFDAGSPVAGPQTGSQLDCTGQIGPWQRIAYSGSRMGDLSTGPATGTGNCLTCVNGYYTSVGRTLSTSYPLPSGTNAVRWAVGKLTVGELRYVKISLRLTAPVPSGGLINGSEVYGGDTAEADDGAHNTWRYMVPSVADNNSNLFVLKTVVGYCTGGAGCTPASADGSFIPANAKLRYRIIYMNTGNATQSNVVLSDTLPCQTNANPVSNINIVSGPVGLPTPNPPVLAAGNCGTNPDTRQTFSFPALATLGPGEAGAIELDVLTNAALGALVTNTAKIASNEIPTGVTSVVNSFVQAAANLSVTKSTSTPTVVSGGTATYTITVTNLGTANATAVQVYDILPTSGGSGTPPRFSFNTGSSVISGLTAVTPSVVSPPTLVPYNTGANQEQVLWDFTGQSLAPGATLTITFGATVGASVPASATPYYDSVAVVYTGGSAPMITSDNVAGVTVSSSLSVTKSINCVYSGGSCVAYSGFIPANAKVRYRVTYANTGGGAVADAVLSDTLPCQAVASPVSYNGTPSTVSIVSGPISAPSSATLSSIPTGSCTTGTRQVFSFPSTTIYAGQSGTIDYDVQTNATVAYGTVVNDVTLSGAAVTPVSSEIQTTVQTAPVLTINKTASVTGAKPGDTVTYTLTVTNVGTAAASGISVYDWLPTGGQQLTGAASVTNGSTTVNGTGTLFLTELANGDMILINGVYYTVAARPSNTQLTLSTAYTGVTASGLTLIKVLTTSSAPNRYSFNTGSSAFGGVISPVTPTVAIPPTKSPYNNIPAGTNPNAGNMQEVVWDFGSQTLAAGSSFTITFSATIGASVPTGYYSNNARVYYNGSQQADAPAASMNVAGSIADVAVTKSNGVLNVPSLGTTTYTIVITNNGPDAANNTTVVDAAVAGLSKTGVSCVAGSGAVCPGTLTVALLEGTGLVIPTLPNGGVITLTVPANITISSGSVANSATAVLPSGIYDGNWNNNTATDTDLVLLQPALTVLKSVVAYWDPVNKFASPKNIPGALMSYTITVTNTGPGTVDNNATLVTDVIPAQTTMYVDTSSGDPVTFSCSSTPACGLSFNYAADVKYTNQSPLPATPGTACSNYTYTPTGAYDANVKGVCINPTGTLNGSNASFSILLRVMVN